MSETSKDNEAKHLNFTKDTESQSNGVVQDASLAQLGYVPELVRNRSMTTILFQSLAITAVPFGEGTALTSAIYGGGQLSYFVGWVVVSILDQCVFMSLAELCSKFPTSAGPVSTVRTHKRRQVQLMSSSTTSPTNFYRLVVKFELCYPSLQGTYSIKQDRQSSSYSVFMSWLNSN